VHRGGTLLLDPASPRVRRPARGRSAGP
jgi:hypothetical protein